MIELKNIERSYKTGAGQTWVLRRINLTIQEGEFLTIMGPSGAGKSSLLNVLALLDDQWLGEYWFDGSASAQNEPQATGGAGKEEIGMVFQSYHLLDDLTVQENIDLPLSYKDIPAQRAPGTGCRYTRPFSDCRQERSVPVAAFRRTATAGRHCARGDS